MRILVGLIGLFALFTCKRVKLDPVAKDHGNDTVVYQPTYWCVKEAVSLMGDSLYYRFEYNSAGQVAVARAYKWNEGGIYSDSDLRYSIHYEYENGQMVLVKKESQLQGTYERSIAYAGGKPLLEMETNSHMGDIRKEYRYLHNGVDTKAIINKRMIYIPNDIADTLSTTYRHYPDSSIGEIRYALAHVRKMPVYHSKEKLLKNERKCIMYTGSVRDTSTLTPYVNGFDPLVWDLFQPYSRHFYAAYTVYSFSSQVMDLRNQKHFVQNIYARTFHYDFDEQGRLTKMTAVEGGKEYPVLSFTY